MILDASGAALAAEAILRGWEGWKVEFNKPFTVSRDEKDGLWAVFGSTNLFGSILGSWTSPVIVLGDDGRVIACYSSVQ